MTEPLLDVARATSPSTRQRLMELVQLEGNDQCADCGEPNPGWASVNIGVFLCTQCAGVHRSLGVEKSFILSLTLDVWTHEQVDALIERGGNTKINHEYEYCVPKVFEVPQGNRTLRKDRQQYIEAKYVEELFKYREGKSGSPRHPKRNLSCGSGPSSPVSPRSRSSSNGESKNVAMVEYKGIVYLELIEAKNLIVKDIVTSDPYFVANIGLQKCKSSVKKRTLNPKYNESFQFSWDGRDRLMLEVFDKDQFSKDDHMGVAEVSLSDLLEGKDITGWFPISHRNHHNRLQGEVFIKLTFLPLQ